MFYGERRNINIFQFLILYYSMIMESNLITSLNEEFGSKTQIQSCNCQEISMTYESSVQISKLSNEVNSKVVEEINMHHEKNCEFLKKELNHVGGNGISWKFDRLKINLKHELLGIIRMKSQLKIKSHITSMV